MGLVYLNESILNEASFSRFWDHYSKNIPIAIFTTYIRNKKGKLLDKEKNRISMTKANEIFQKARKKIKAFGFGFIKGRGKYIMKGTDLLVEEPCYIVYGIPLEGTNQFYDGTIKPPASEYKVVNGYSPAEAEAKLKELAIDFGHEYGQQSFLFIPIEGDAYYHFTEDVYEDEDAETREGIGKLLYSDGYEENVGKVKLNQRGDGIGTSIKGRFFSCDFDNVDNALEEALTFNIDLFHKVRNREILLRYYKEKPDKYFSAKIKQYPHDFIRTRVKANHPQTSR